MTKIAYTVYDTQDSSWKRDGLSEAEARELLAERNAENSRYGDRYAMVTDAEFLIAQTKQMLEADYDE